MPDHDWHALDDDSDDAVTSYFSNSLKISHPSKHATFPPPPSSNDLDNMIVKNHRAKPRHVEYIRGSAIFLFSIGLMIVMYLVFINPADVTYENRGINNIGVALNKNESIFQLNYTQIFMVSNPNWVDVHLRDCKMIVRFKNVNIGSIVEPQMTFHRRVDDDPWHIVCQFNQPQAAGIVFDHCQIDEVLNLEYLLTHTESYWWKHIQRKHQGQLQIACPK